MKGEPINAIASIAVVDRRDMLAGAGAAGLVAALLGIAGPAIAAAADSTSAEASSAPLTFAQAMKAILGETKPVVSPRIVLELPEIAENGNTVPFTLSIDSPMTATDNVKAAHIVSSGNPQPSVASFHFSDVSAKAVVSSRMRLGKTQDVIAIAELSDGTFLIATRNVKVTIGGCGG